MDSNDWCVVRSRVLLGRIRLNGLQLDPLRVDRLLLNTLFLVPEEVFLSSTGIFFLSLGAVPVSVDRQRKFKISELQALDSKV